MDSKNGLEVLERFLGIIDISGRTFIAGNFLINLIFSTTLNLLWSLANALQIIVHMPLINIAMPFNALLTCAILSNVASFEVIPTEFFYNLFLNFDPDNNLGETEGLRYELIGMETSNFMINSGTLFWCVLAWIFASATYLTIKLGLKISKRKEGSKM